MGVRKLFECASGDRDSIEVKALPIGNNNTCHIIATSQRGGEEIEVQLDHATTVALVAELNLRIRGSSPGPVPR